MKTANGTILIIIGMILIVMLPHFPRLPVWVIAWCLVFWSYGIFAEKNNRSKPAKLRLRLLTIAGFAGILLTYRQGLNLEACISLLATMTALKIFELKTDKDKMTIVFMTYFFVLANLNYSTSVTVIIHMFISILITTTVLFHINYPQGRLIRQLGQAAKMMIQAVPLMLIIFFLFPRLPDSLVERDGKSTGVTGFTDRLSMGDIATLAQSSELAFRVEFNDSVPRQDQLYWRGVVFHYFDGKTWKIEPRRITRVQPLEGDRRINYSVMLEPHNKKWLFTLDYPATGPDFARILREHVLYADTRVRERIRYELTSVLDTNPKNLHPQDLNYIRLEGKGNPRTRELARYWKDTAGNTEELVDLALEYFRTSDFVYTLNPEQVRGHVIDDFLFRTRSGYCEHYASAFALLMHEAGIPARVVGGYLGGELNPYGDFLTIRQSNAHAWTEIWHTDKGWVRIDPTLVVAPDRMVQNTLPDGSPSFVNFFGLSDYYNNLTLGWDALNNQWNAWFYSYSFYRQKRLLANLGIGLESGPGLLKQLVMILAAVFIFVGILFTVSLKKGAVKQDAVLLIYNRFCNKLARIDLPRKPAQGPMDYADHVSDLREDLASEVSAITELYIQLRYDRGGGEEMMKDFRNKVRRFRPKKVIV